MVQDYKLGLRMLLKYPGLTIAGGLALAIAIGIGAGWYDVSRDFLRPTIPLPEGDRIVEIADAEPGRRRRAAITARLLCLAARCPIGRGSWCVSHRRAEPGSWRRAARARDDRGNDRIGFPAGPGAAAHRPAAARRRRTARRRHLWSCSVIACGSSSSADARTHRANRAARQDPDHGRRRDARRLRVPNQPPALGPASAASLRVFAARGSGGARVWPAGAGCDTGPGQRGARHAGRTRGGRLATDTRASAAAMDGVRRRISRQSHVGRVRAHSPAHPARVDHRLHQRRHARLRAHGDTRGGDRHALCARRRPIAHRGATVRRSAGAGVCGSGHRTRGYQLGGQMGHGSLLRRPRRRSAVLVRSGPETDDDPVRRAASPSPAPRSWVCFPRSRSPGLTCTRNCATLAPAGPRCNSASSGRRR